MKRILTVLAIVLFTINASAQETKPTTKEKEKCCAKKMTEEEIAKCKAKCKAEGKECKAEDMAKCKKKEGKKCCQKKE